MATDSSNFELSPRQIALLNAMSQRMGKPASAVLDELLTQANPPNPIAEVDATLHDRLVRAGALGCFDGPADLSTNPAHLDGFGESG